MSIQRTQPKPTAAPQKPPPKPPAKKSRSAQSPVHANARYTPPKATDAERTVKTTGGQTVRVPSRQAEKAGEMLANARYSDTAREQDRQKLRTTERKPVHANARYTEATDNTKDKTGQFAPFREQAKSGEKSPEVKTNDGKTDADKAKTDDKNGDKKTTNEGLTAFISRIGSKYLNKLSENLSLPKNLLLGAVSGIQQKVGYMDVGPRAWSCFGKGLMSALKKSDSIFEAFKKLDGKNVCLGQTPFHWRALAVKDKNGKDVKAEGSDVDIKKADKDNKNLVTFALGSYGGPERAFKNSVSGIFKHLKSEYGAHTKILNGYNKDGQAMARAYKQIADYAKKNPDKMIRVITYCEGHGNTQGGNGKQGSGTGIHNGVPSGSEKAFRKVQGILANIKNVGLYNMISCCHAGAFADRPDIA